MALRDQPYFPLYVQDFMTDEALNECSAESTGVYIRIMCLMHKSKEYGTFSLKEKDKQSSSTCYDFATPLAKACYDFAEKLDNHFPYKVDVIAKALQELIENEVLVLDGDKILQRRMVRDFEKSTAKAEAGRQGGLAKAEASKTPSKVSSTSLADTEYEYVNENDNVIDTKTTKKRIVKEKIDNMFFESFWESYPKKVSKKEAERAFFKTSPLEYDQIMASLEKWKKSYDWTKDGGQYIPNAATWLNGERWNDEIPGGTSTGPKKNASGGYDK